MSSLTWPFRGAPSESDPRSLDAVGQRAEKLLLFALAGGAAGGLLEAVGGVVPVVDGGSPGFASAPLLVVLALLGPALAWVNALRGRLPVAAGVLAGVAALAPGRLVLDLQLAADPTFAARPELYRATSFVFPAPGAGLWLLLAGHAVVLVAGVLAMRASGNLTDPAGAPGARPWLLPALLAALVAAVGVTMAPYSSDDPFLPAPNAFEGPVVAMAAILLIACLTPLAAAIGTGFGAAEIGRGGLLGLAVALAGVAVPSLVAAVSVPAAGISAGPIVTLAGAAALVVVALVGDRAPAAAPSEEDAPEAALPGARRLNSVTGALALVTAAFAVAGTFTPQVLTAAGAPAAQSPARWLLLFSGAVTGLAGLALLVPRIAAVVRPAISVCSLGVPFAAVAVFGTARSASEIGGLSDGSGVVWTWLALVFAVVTACCSVVSGMVERDVIDGDERRTGPDVLAPLAAAAMLAVVGAGLPPIDSAGYRAPGLWANFGTESWGVLLIVLAIVGACALVPRSRPSRAAALLVGAAAVTSVRLVELPALSDGVPDATASTGWWLTLASTVALLVAAVLAVARKQS
ncbi:hypothetical protein [Amycolatopsis sp. CA-230715]|uniref:hypothetical protein n=1 Tax=Amycolatopsis sp. CA-230715 TaxID=2745196 RepID=UPI001C00BD3B|nr:hypothetical protein [Amycolatopsis sp. CA-230715]QWF79552.1 hypothetical protein HUW46_02960 [Amycolatopsis sp. CA-230715]